MKHKVPVRPVDLNLGADGQIGQVGQVIGEEAFLHTVHAKLKAVADGRRSDGVSAGLHLALRVLSHGGDKLAGSIGKALQLVDDKNEVVALCDFRDADFAFETRGIKFTGQGFSRWGRDGDPEKRTIGSIASGGWNWQVRNQRLRAFSPNNRNQRTAPPIIDGEPTLGFSAFLLRFF